MSEKIELLACPFCGEDDKTPSAVGAIGSQAPRIEPIPAQWDLPWLAVICRRCGARTGEFREPQFAADAWNMRNIPKSERWPEKESVS